MTKLANKIDMKEMMVNVLNTGKTKAGEILLEVDAPEIADLLAVVLTEVVGASARVIVLQRRTPVMLLNVPNWITEEEVKSSLTQAGVAPWELIRNAKSSISLRTNSGGRGARVARFIVSYPAVLTLAGVGHVVVGWTRFRVKLILFW